MGLVPRTNTPSDYTRRLYIVGATGIVAALSIACLVFTSIFYSKHHDDAQFSSLDKIKPLLIVALTVESLIIVVFIIEVIFFAALPKVAALGAYNMTMMILTECFILCCFICYCIFASEYTKNKVDDVKFYSAMKDLSIVTIVCWCIAIVIFVWVTVLYIKMYQCE